MFVDDKDHTIKWIRGDEEVIMVSEVGDHIEDVIVRRGLLVNVAFHFGSLSLRMWRVGVEVDREIKVESGEN